MKFREAAREQFERDKRAVLAILNRAHKESLRRKQTIEWHTVEREWSAYLQEAGDEWREAFAPIVRGLVTRQAESLNTDFGFAFNVHNLFAEQWFDDYTLHFAETIADTTGLGLNLALQRGMEEGWSIHEMQGHIGDLFRQWTDGDVSPDELAWLEARLPGYRAEMIARTETIRASARGSEALYSHWGVKTKEWLCTEDDRTCPFCLAMMEQTRGLGRSFFGKGERMDLMVGESWQTLIFDYEAIDGPPLHPSCRCVLLPVVVDLEVPAAEELSY